MAKRRKFSDMTIEEIITFIDSKITDIKRNIDIYHEYYDNKIITYSEELSKDNVDNLKKYAYEVKNISDITEWANKMQIIIDSLSLNLNKKPKRGEIWTCELGENIGSEENKTRPVIIIQNDTGNLKSPTTIIVPISNRPKKIEVHVKIKKSDYILMEDETDQITGTILCEQIKVVSKARLGRHIATLETEFVINILNNKLTKSIDL